MRKVLVSALAAVLVAGLAPATFAAPVPSARTPQVARLASSPVVAPEVRGGDLSWPQCPKGMGIPGRRTQGQPLPWNTAKYWIFGLTNGRAWTKNPCLAWQLKAAKKRGVLASAYTMLSYPNKAERAKYSTKGPFGTSTYANKIANTGYSQTIYALNTMKAAGLKSPFVWIDVEPRSDRAYSATDSRNRALIKGALRAIADRGLNAGIYTYANAWNDITSGMQIDVPLWAPGHSRATTFAAKMAESLASCSRTSFTGGPLVMTQWVYDKRDHDITCPAITSVTVPLWVQL